MGNCITKGKSKKQKKGGDAYKIPTEPQDTQTQVDDLKKASTLEQHPNFESFGTPYLKVLRDSVVNTSLREKNTSIPLIVTNYRKPPSIAPALAQLKTKWERIYSFEPNTVKAKCQTFDDNSANNEDVQALLKDLKHSFKIHKWKSPTIFKLDLQGCRKLTDKTFKALASELSKNFGALKTLIINFSECALMKDKDLEVFASIVFPHVSKVHKLELFFNRCPGLSDLGMKRLGYLVGRFLVEIKSLKISFNECGNVTEKGIKAYGSFIPRRLNNLKHYSISFNDCVTMSSNDVLVINQKFNGLETFKLHLNRCFNLSDEVLEKFYFQVNRCLSEVKHLHLDFSSCNDFSDRGLEVIESNIKSLKKLQKLTLELGRCHNIKNQGVEKLSLWIANSLTGLEALTLDLNECLELNGKVLPELGDRLGSLQKLKKLNIRLGRNEEFTDKYLKAFAVNLAKRNPRLINLALTFAGCEKITDVGFEALVIEVRKLATIQILSLDFPGCTHVTDRGAKMVEVGIGKYLPNLQQLTVDFRGCRGINYMTKDQLRANWTYRARFEVF